MATAPNLAESLKQSIHLVDARKAVAARTPKSKTAKVEKYTLANAFNYYFGPHSGDEHDTLNDDRAIRAVAFLLTYNTEHGNEALDGNAANGLARVLEFVAHRIFAT